MASGRRLVLIEGVLRTTTFQSNTAHTAQQSGLVFYVAGELFHQDQAISGDAARMAQMLLVFE